MIWLAIFGVALLVSAYYVFALIFHWVKYGSTLPLVWIAMPIYLAGAGFLVFVALIALVNI